MSVSHIRSLKPKEDDLWGKHEDIYKKHDRREDVKEEWPDILSALKMQLD